MEPPNQDTTLGIAPPSARVSLPARYRVTKLIATGGMGSVWVAEDDLLRRPVAIKVLAENLAQQERFRRRFDREARTAASLSGHPNVLTIYDVGEHDGHPFIVMEHLPGGTVADRLRAGVRRQQVLSWLSQAATGLDFAHERGVVHRDVKPANLLFDERERLVIADFGIAQVAYEETLTGSGELLGTAAYISPEQARGESGGPASDRYSLAVVAYELLTRQRPFGGGNFVEQALQHVEMEPRPASELVPEISPVVDDVLLRGLAKDPAGRSPSASAFVEALARAFAEPAGRPSVVESHDARAPTPPEPHETAGPPTEPELVALRSSGRRRFLPVALVVAAAIGTGVLAAAALTGNGDRGQTDANPDRGSSKRDQSAPSQAAEPGAGANRNATSTEAAQLNDQGFRLMKAGRYDEAIPQLQRAVAAFPEGSSELAYAYALYNLGRSLRLSGRAQEAIPILERRLEIPNQRETVARELEAARRSASR